MEAHNDPTPEPEAELVQPEPEYSGSELHPSQVEGYEPKFDRQGVHRRVLGHVTDEVDFTPLGARNTLRAVAFAVARDDFTPQVPQDFEHAEAIVGEKLDDLVDAGLLEKRDDDSYVVTDAGHTELAN